MMITEPVRENREECVVVEKRSVWEPRMRMRAKEVTVGDPTHFNGNSHSRLLALGARRAKQLMQAVETRHARCKAAAILARTDGKSACLGKDGPAYSPSTSQPRPVQVSCRVRRCEIMQTMAFHS